MLTFENRVRLKPIEYVSVGLDRHETLLVKSSVHKTLKILPCAPLVDLRVEANFNCVEKFHQFTQYGLYTVYIIDYLSAIMKLQLKFDQLL